MYSILFIIDNEFIEIPKEIVFKTIKNTMLSYGFEWVGGYLFFGNQSINVMDCVLLIQKISKENPWFSSSVKDIRLLRIEEIMSLNEVFGNNQI